MALSASFSPARRLFLRSACGALATVALPQGLAAEEAPAPVLVCLNLEGGLDGLSVVVPYGEDAYYRARPGLALPPLGRAGGVLPLADGFGLHPGLEPLHRLYTDGSLAIVPAAGGAHFGRSHFRARQILHAGAPPDAAPYSVSDGWANRYAQTQDKRAAAPRLFSTARERPAALAGSCPVGTIDGQPLVAGEAGVAYLAALRRLYESTNDPFARAAQQALAHAELLHQRVRQVKVHGRYSKHGGGLRAAARIIRANVGAEIVWVSVPGFDTHKKQGSVRGTLANRLTELGADIAAFQADLGTFFASTTLVTLTEFGRALVENGAGGTDHGAATCMLVLGGRVRGGRLAGTWPGLGKEALHEGRELAVTTDYRSVLADVLVAHFGLDLTSLLDVFPGFDPTAAPSLDLLAS